MNIKKLNEELNLLLETQYQNEFDSEEYYVVTFKDGSTDDNFWCGDDDLFYKKKRIAHLYNGENFREVADKIRTYAEGKLGKEIEKIVDGAGQSLLESTNEQVGTRITLNSTEPMKGTIIKDKYVHPETGKTCRDVRLDDGRIIQVYNSHFTIDESLNEKSDSKATKLQKIKRELEAKIKKLYKDDPDTLDWISVEPEIKKGHYDDGSDLYAIIINTELSYDSTLTLADNLEDILQKYDKYAYFEHLDANSLIGVVNL